MKFSTFTILLFLFFFTSQVFSREVLITKVSYDKNTGYLYKISFDNNIDGKTIVFDTQTQWFDAIEFLDHNKNKLNNRLVSLKKHIYEVKNTHSNIYFIRIKFYGKTLPLPLKTYTIQEYYDQNRTNNMLDGMYIGFFLMVLLMNLFFFLCIRYKVFLYYMIFLIGMNLAIFSVDGYLLTFVNTAHSYKVLLFIKFLLPLSCIGFIINLLNLDSKSIIVISAIFSTPILILYIMSNISRQSIYETWGDVLLFSHLFLFWTYGLRQFKENNYAKFFVVGYSFVLFSSILYTIATSFDFLPIKTSINHIKLGAIFEMMILTYTISYRVKILQEELAKVQEQLTEYLNQLKAQESDNHKITKSLKEQHDLSEREAEVLYYLLQQHTNKQISETLFISIHTVKFHVRNLYKKLNIKNRQEISKIHIVTP